MLIVADDFSCLLELVLLQTLIDQVGIVEQIYHFVKVLLLIL